MGIIHSSTRFLVSKQEDEEGGYESPNPCGDYAERLPKPFILGISIYKLLKGLLQKVSASILCLAKPATEAADPLLPPPVSSIRSEPRVTTFDDEELEVDVDCVLWRDEGENPTSESDRDVVVCVPGSAVFLEEIITTGINLTEEDEDEDEEVNIVTVVQEERWIKHYSSRQRLLLVGEGDFSFSACLAVAFQWASNIIATSLDSQAFLKKNYSKSMSNIEELRCRGSIVMHGINATTMANHELLGQLTFDRIIYNFPYAGLDVKNESRQVQLEKHQTLVRLFLQNAREMLSEEGEIHITHKTNGFHREWRLESLARGCGLRLVEAIKFNNLDYPGYNTKCGFGGNKNFYCNPSKTYKFGLSN